MSTRRGFFILYREGQTPEFRPRMKLSSLYSTKTTIDSDSRFFKILPPIEVPIEVEPLGARGQTRAVPLTTVRIV